MEKLKIGDVIEVVKIITDPYPGKKAFKDGSQTIGMKDDNLRLSGLKCMANGEYYKDNALKYHPQGLYLRKEYIKPIGRLIVRRLANRDPETII